MHNIIQIIFFLLCCSLSHAQSIPKFVVSSAGTSAQSGGYVMHWTLGEAAISMRSNTDIKLQEGFWQSELGIVKNNETFQSILPIVIYPNPAQNDFTIKIPVDSDFLPLTAYLYAMNGMLMKQWSISSEISTNEISSFPGGVYLLRIVNARNNSFSSIIFKN